MKTLFSTSFLLLFFFVSAQNDDFGIDNSKGIPEGLKEGIVAPSFSGKDQNGKSISLSDRLEKGPVVLIFYRGYWCPVCNRYLSKFQEDIDLILEKGASVIAVSPEQNDGVIKTVENSSLNFSVLSDPSYTIMDKYGVRFLVTDKYSAKIKTFKNADIAENNGDNKPYLPVPATYVIGKDGIIIKTFFDLNYKTRPTAQEIVKFLD